MTQDNSTEIITGAAHGIGVPAAEELATDGCAVTVVDLDESSCAATATPSRPRSPPVRTSPTRRR